VNMSMDLGGMTLNELQAGRRWRALVADEDPTMVWLLQRTLAADFDVTVAENGQRAVDLASVTDPDVVLLDLTMPVLNGVEACRQIRAALPKAPILIVSGHTDQASVVDAFAAGATDYVIKPFSLSQLRARVRACLMRVE